MQGRAEVAVIGAGIVGLAAADALARAGVDALCFEAAEPGSGQSAGYTRVFRHAHDRADLVELVSCARRGWDEWSELAGESTRCGIRPDHTAACWGRNSRGQAGIGVKGDVGAPGVLV